MLYKILLSPEVKRGVIISNKFGIYKLPHDFQMTEGLGLWEIKKYEENN